MGTAGSGTGGAKAGPGGTSGHVDVRCPLVPFPDERAYVSARGNPEVFALEPIVTQRAPLLLEEFRRKRLDLISRCFQSDP